MFIFIHVIIHLFYLQCHLKDSETYQLPSTQGFLSFFQYFFSYYDFQWDDYRGKSQDQNNLNFQIHGYFLKLNWHSIKKQELVFIKIVSLTLKFLDLTQDHVNFYLKIFFSKITNDILNLTSDQLTQQNFLDFSKKFSYLKDTVQHLCQKL